MLVQEIEAKIRTINVPSGQVRVQLKGKYSNGSVSDLMKRYEAVIFPSLWPETFSLVFTEAVSAGCKIVVPNIGAFPERAVDYDGNVFFYAPGDGPGMADALGRALRSQYVPVSTVALKKFFVKEMTGQYIQASESLGLDKLHRPTARKARADSSKATGPIAREKKTSSLGEVSLVPNAPTKDVARSAPRTIPVRARQKKAAAGRE